MSIYINNKIRVILLREDVTMRIWNDLKKLLKALLVFILVGGISIYLYEVYIGVLNEENSEQQMTDRRIYNKDIYNEQLEIQEELEPLMEEIRRVMNGEIIVEEGTDNMLSLFSYNEKYYSGVVEIDSYANLVSAELGENEGRIIIDYSITYYDKNGNCKMKSASTCQ